MTMPIEVVPHRREWKRRFEELESGLTRALGPLIERIEHVGSTVIPGIHAKPIIDIDLVLSDRANFADVCDRLSEMGYAHVGDQGVTGREAFELVGVSADSRDHHLYACRSDATELQRHIAFRDYLLANPDVALDYDRLKRKLAARFREDREAYTEAKSRFVSDILGRAYSRDEEH
jgi:GrpB-like predicted nucleotidyltransferase (UPF0157 family)